MALSHRDDAIPEPEAEGEQPKHATQELLGNALLSGGTEVSAGEATEPEADPGFLPKPLPARVAAKPGARAWRISGAGFCRRGADPTHRRRGPVMA